MVGGSAVSKLAKALLPKSGKLFAAMHGAYLQRKGTQPENFVGSDFLFIQFL
jgi:hypothetical protein